MNSPDTSAREQRILDGAAAHILHYGYAKTTMSDIAEEAGVTRAIVYLHFDSKERLFDALLFREIRRYFDAWLAAFESDTGAGAVDGVFRAALVAVRQSPLLAAMLRQDRQVFSGYLRQPGSILAPIQSPQTWPALLAALQAAGAVRPDLRPDVAGCILNALAAGIISQQTAPDTGPTPTWEEVLDTVGDLLDRALAPDGGGDQAAGKAIILRLSREAQASFNQNWSEHD